MYITISYVYHIIYTNVYVYTGWANKTFIPYEPTFGTHHKKASVVGMDTENKSVTLNTGETLSYDVLVISTGNRGPFPFNIGDRDKRQADLDTGVIMDQVNIQINTITYK